MNDEKLRYPESGSKPEQEQSRKMRRKTMLTQNKMAVKSLKQTQKLRSVIELIGDMVGVPLPKDPKDADITLERILEEVSSLVELAKNE